MTMIDLDTLTEQELFPGYRGRFVHSDNMTLAYWDVIAGAVAPEHSHPHEQVLTVLEGQFELNVDGKVMEVTPRTPVILPSNVPHGGIALTKCRLLDIFHPVREDFR